MAQKEVWCDRCKRPMRITIKSPPGGVLGSNTSLPMTTKTEPLSASGRLSGKMVVYYCEGCHDTKMMEE